MTVGDLMPRLSGVVARAGGLGADVRDRAVRAIAYDSRRATAGAIFVAISGQRFDGAAFAADAMGRGAMLVVSASAPPVDGPVAWVRVEDARLALAELAAAFYHDPSHDLTVVGVTGTNGKTTTTYLLAAIFDAAGWPCGRIGSVGYDTGGTPLDAERTTPEAPEVQALLREMVQHQRTACAMEVSSHALAMRRVEGTRFAAAVFSNLTRDHLDYHPDMGHYFGMKRRLFDMLPAGAPAIINTDDPFGLQLVEMVGRPVTYAIDRAADVTPDRVESSLSGTSIDVRTPRGRLQLRSALPGRLNVYNVLAAVSAAVALDVPAAPSSTATTLFTSRNCSTPGTSSSPIWRSRRRRRQPGGGPTRPVPPPRAPHHLSASYDAAPRKGARPPGTGARPGAAVAGHRPPVRRGSRTGHRYEAARDRGTRGDGAGRRRRTHARAGPRLGCRAPPAASRAKAGRHTRSQALSTPVAGASMMAPLPTTAHVHMTAKKTLDLANPYGFSTQQRGGPLHELVRALESMGADVWEPFARNNQIGRASAGWAHRIG